MPSIFQANSSSVLLEGKEIEGLQSIAWRVVTEREDVRAINKNERIDVSFGLRVVLGELVVKSHNEDLDKHLEEQTSFNLSANLKKDKGMGAAYARSLGFQDCFVETKRFQMDAGGTALTTYAFTASRVKETPGK